MSACAKPPDLEPLAQAIIEREQRLPASLGETEFGQSVVASVQNSPRLARSFAEVEEARAQITAVGSSYYPSIGATLQLPMSGEGFLPGLSLTQLVFDAGGLRARQVAAQARLLGRTAGRMDAGAQAALEAVEAWVGVVTSREILAVNEASLAELERITQQIVERAEAGAGSSADVLTAQSRLENLRVGVAAAQSDVTSAEAIYAEIFDEVAKDDFSLPPTAPQLPSLSIEASPTVLEAEAERLAALSDLTEAEAGRVSPVNVTISQIDGEDPEAELVSTDVIPLGGRQSARITALQGRLGVREADVQATQREIERRVAILSAESRAADQRLKAARSAAQANRENVKTAREQFRIARRSLLELLDTEREALAAERQFISSEHDKVVIGYALLAATGDILDVFGIDLNDLANDPGSEGNQ